MKHMTFVVLMFVHSAASAQSAPYCVATDAGRMCHYYVVSNCQQDAMQNGGVCVANTEPARVYQSAPQTQLQYPDIAGSYQRGLELGQRRRQEREAHEARMRLIESQAASVQEGSLRTGTITYICSGRDGSPYRTTTPAIGCIVKSIDD